ncbi:replicative DNA helicase [Pelagibius litoralis]|uniref:Replicative DNA helicase n=1 Tax=Pelagibius litoralis TaxID=374515 RepID=A0A967EZL9_9PROT|nr:replicative DNA helicase [Pelagibius litoralis]NIA70309.1 replicative DNA helicase [Pelagibius litoralis]
MESTRPNLTPLPDPLTNSDHLRLPPSNDEAEQALLGAILANNAAYEKVSDFLRVEHFADGVHARIFEACGKLIERGQIANAIQLKNLFEQESALAEVGGAQYLAQLQSSYVTIINAADYGKTIHDLYLRRELITLGEDLVNDAFEHDLDTEATDQIEGAEDRLYKLAEVGQTEGGLIGFKSAILESLHMTEAAMKRDGLSGVSSGLQDLDALLGGFHPSDLVILAARPSMGKTSLATNIAFNVAAAPRMEKDAEGNPVEQRQPVAFFSLEMSAEQLATRILSERSGVRSDAMRRGDIRDEDFDSVFEKSRELYELPLFVDDTPALSVSQVRTRARRLKRQHGLSMIVIDYLQLMQPPPNKRSDNRVQEVSEITRGLKALAKDLDVPVIALSQLSRAVEQREDKHPQLADLRESGSIEQDADVVMFIYREQYYVERAEPTQRDGEDDNKFHERLESWKTRCERAYGKAEIIVAKQRHGPIGSREFSFDGNTTRFSDLIDDAHLPDHY